MRILLHVVFVTILIREIYLVTKYKKIKMYCIVMSAEVQVEF